MIKVRFQNALQNIGHVFLNGSQLTHSLWMSPREAEKVINIVLMRDFSKQSFFDLGDQGPTQVALCRLLSRS